MAFVTDRPPRDAFSTLLRDELSLTPERWRAIARIVTATVIVVVVAMTFQIPLPAYVVYIVFLVSQADAASTLMTAAGGLLASSFAVVASLLFYVFDASEPALRLPLLALSAFAGMFLSRTSKLGPVAFLGGYVLVLSQTLLDDIPAPEPLVHQLLWLWVIVAVPMGVTVLVNLLFGESPVALSRTRATRLLDRLAGRIENPGSDHAQDLRGEFLALGDLGNKAMVWDKRLKAYAQEDARLIALLLEIESLARSLPTSLDAEVRQALGAVIREAGQRFVRRRAGMPSPEGMIELPRMPSDCPSATALRLALQELRERASGHRPEYDDPPPKTARFLLLPDAFRDRSHARFALKVMLAVLASYATYTLLDWPGIRTAVTTCFFVSLTTFGESIHKFTLRVTGAIVGGLLAGLCIVFVLPSMSDIGELCLLIAVVSAFSAWISTGGEAIAYAGMQIAFAFFLGVLQGYGPASDLTVLRDRIVGILIGNAWVTLIFLSLGSASAVSQARALHAAALGKLGQLLNHAGKSSAWDKLSVSQDLSRAALLRARGSFEWRALELAPRPTTAPAPADVEQLTALTFVLLRLRDSRDPPVAPSADDGALAAQLLALSQGHAPTDLEMTAGGVHSPLLRQAREQLATEIDHASRTV